MKYLFLLLMISCFGNKETTKVEPVKNQARGISSINNLDDLPLHEQIELQARELEEKETK